MKEVNLDKVNELMGTDEELVEKEFDDEIESEDISGLDGVELEKLLHELTARRLVEAMRRPEPGAGMIQAARGFLRDNEVSGLDIPGTASTTLREELKKRAPFLKLTTGTEGSLSGKAAKEG